MRIYLPTDDISLGTYDKPYGYDTPTTREIEKAKAEIMEWISQQTEEERQEEEATEKEWVWRTHHEHKTKHFQIKGYDAPTLTAKEYDKKVASIRCPYKPFDLSQFLADIAVKEEAKMKEKEENADEERKEEDQNEKIIKPDNEEAEMTKKEEKAVEEMKQDDHERKKKENMTKPDCDPDNIATKSIYPMKCDKECSVSNQLLNTFLSIQEYMASNHWIDDVIEQLLIYEKQKNINEEWTHLRAKAHLCKTKFLESNNLNG